MKKHKLIDKDAKSAGSSSGTDFPLNTPNGIQQRRVKHATRLNGETKLDTSGAFGQITVKHHPEKGWYIDDKARNNRPRFAEHVEKHIIPHLNKTQADPSKVRRTASGRVESVRVHHPDLEPAKAYLKDHHVDVLHVGSHGTYGVSSVGKKLGLPEVKGTGVWTIREKNQKGEDKEPTRTVMFQPGGKRGEKKGGLVPSNINLSDPKHVKEFKKRNGY